MWRSRLTGAALLVVVGAMAGIAAATAAPHRPSEPKTIVVDKLAFGPAPRPLHVGDVVQWVNRDIFQHSATASDKSFDVELKPGATARTVLRKPGTIAYICRYHPGMKGELKVVK